MGAMRRLSLELTGTEEFWNDPYFEQIICDELCQMPKLPHTYKRRAFKTVPSGRPRGGKNEGKDKSIGVGDASEEGKE